ncbi:Myb-like domain-containing protein [Abeliophyllum distichum]|uniref:Myb-like domain-containing protein n=1 Tax=Abeliophyllum distichum TaxID=126358 RepID=A0ABD1VC22_9LAMI
MMSSKVVLTYKRRRPPSRFDLSNKNVCLERPSECLDFKASATLDKHEVQIEGSRLENQNKESGTCHEHYRDKVGGSMFQCQICYQQYPIERLNSTEHAPKGKSLCSDCIKEQHSSSRLEGKTLSVKSDVTQMRVHSNALLEGSSGIKCSHESKDASLMEKITLEEMDLAHKDKFSSLDNNSAAKRKFTSTLITFRRRSKQNKDTTGPNLKPHIQAGENSSSTAEGCNLASAVTTCTYESPPAKSCSKDHTEDVKNGKDIHLRDSFVRNDKELYNQETDYKSEFHASAPVTEIGIQVDEHLKSLHKTANDISSFAVQLSSDSLKETSFHSYVAMDLHENHPVNPSRNSSHVATKDLEHKISQSLSNEDLNTMELPDEISGNKCSQASWDLYVAAPVRDIDCNVALDSGLDEPYFHKVSPRRKSLEFLNGNIKEDKSHDCINHPPQFRDIASKNNFLQLFPENRSHDLLPSANTHQKAITFVESEESRSQLKPSGPQSCFDQTSSLLRHKMMLDNILRRARVAKGNRSSFSDRFESPTTWSEEELDCLWIGVRRHGRGNWDAMLKDPRLHFLPWRTPRDLAERWDDDQSKLMYNMPISQPKYASTPDVLSYRMKNFSYPKIKHPSDDVQLSVGDVCPRYEDSVKKISPMDFINIQHNGQLQKQVTDSRTFPSYSCAVPVAESSLHMGPMTSMDMKGCTLPPWLREAVAIPPRPPDTSPTSVASLASHPGMQLFSQPYVESNLCHQQSRKRLNNKYTISGKTELQTGGRSHLTNSPLITRCAKTKPPDNNQDDLIIIHSDASSEETISDDHSVRP